MNKLKKIMLLTLVLSAGLLLPSGMNAQTGGGVFYRGDNAESTESPSMMNRSGTGGYNLNNQQFGSDNGGYELYNQTFGQETPVGSGIAILMLAGAGYAAMKSRNKKSNK